MLPVNSDFSDQDGFLKCKQKIAAKLTKLLKRAEKLILERKHTLLMCQNWQDVQHEGELIQANLYRIRKGMSEIAVSDWLQDGKERIIALSVRLSPHAQAAQLFRRSKKLRVGEPHAVRMLHLAYEAVKKLENQIRNLENIASPTELTEFCKAGCFGIDKKAAPQKVKERLLPKPYRIFSSASGMQIWVGKSAKNNDLLTFHYAKGSDWWLHAKDYPGSHVVLRVLKNQDLLPADLHDAAELALRFSKFNQCNEGAVAVSQVKNLVRIKGSPGKVLLPKHKTLLLTMDPKRWERLKSTLVSNP